MRGILLLPYGSIPYVGEDGWETQMQQQVQEIMAEAVAEGQGRRASGSRTSVDIMACEICGKTKGNDEMWAVQGSGIFWETGLEGGLESAQRSFMPNDGGNSGERRVS